MAGEFLSLQEVADELGKSTQTIRRMIKKGEIRAERIRTPQGFQYAIERGALTYKRPAQATQEPSQNRPDPSPTPFPSSSPMMDTKEALTSQDSTDYGMALISQNVQAIQEDSSAFLENDFYILEPSQSAREGLTHERLIELVTMHHKEKLMLITILERLQAELAEERRAKKKSLSRLRKLWERFKRA